MERKITPQMVRKAWKVKEDHKDLSTRVLLSRFTLADSWQAKWGGETPGTQSCKACSNLSFTLLSHLSLFRHARVSSTYPCPSARPSVGLSVRP